MPSYDSPGVYVEEVASDNRPIQGVGTSTAAFVGLAERGPVGESVKLFNRADYLRHFGEPRSDQSLAHAVRLFFANGGGVCYVVRTGPHTAGTIAMTSSTTTFSVGGTSTLIVTASSLGAFSSRPSPGDWGDRLSVEVRHNPDSTDGFDLVVRLDGDIVREYERLVLDPDNPQSVEAAVNDQSIYISVQVPAAALGVVARPGAETRPLLGGSDAGGTAIVPSDFTGPDGLQALNPLDDVNMIAIPDSADRAVMMDGVAYCERRRDCVFIAHARLADDSAQRALAYKQATGPDHLGQAPFNSSYGALYVPYIIITDPLTNAPLRQPPDGAVMGRYAAVDQRRGVHKAPAGIIDGVLRGVLELQSQFSHAEIASLNPEQVNVLRFANGIGNHVWGARTLSAIPELRYVPTRRLLLFIEQSILRATSWTVFEPNTPDLWNRITRSAEGFLRTAWRTGALFGETENMAFRVKCDAETNTTEVIEAGQVVTEIKVAITKPAEFVIFRITQAAAGTLG